MVLGSSAIKQTVLPNGGEKKNFPSIEGRTKIEITKTCLSYQGRILIEAFNKVFSLCSNKEETNTAKQLYQRPSLVNG